MCTKADKNRAFAWKKHGGIQQRCGQLSCGTSASASPLAEPGTGRDAVCPAGEESCATRVSSLMQKKTQRQQLRADVVAPRPLLLHLESTIENVGMCWNRLVTEPEKLTVPVAESRYVSRPCSAWSAPWR